MGDVNGLIKALREEIAIAGEKGATVKDILKTIKHFYQEKKASQTGEELDIPLQNVDKAFQDRVWSWLVKDRYIRVGQNQEGNSLTLDEIQAQEKPLRLFTTEQQIWTTLAGHEKDGRKIPAKSFELLQIIAAHREKGITQPELVKITGQDKRSVPQRTQRLADAGHVKKLPVLANHSNTSLLIHTRFIKDFATPSARQQVTSSLGSGSAPDRLFLGHNKFVRVEKEIRHAIATLAKENSLLMWSDLKKKTKVTDPGVSRLLAGAIRRLEDLGVTERVRASASIDKDSQNDLHRCVRLQRPPTDRDWRILFDLSKQEQNKLVESNGREDESQDQELEAQANDLDETVKVSEQSSTDIDPVQDLLVTTWHPDRLLAHIVRSALLAAGTNGLATKDLKKIVTGPFYIRPVDRFLDRCVWRWQKSQPLHLRHLAIVRDSAQLGKTSFYVHFVHDAFGIKVENQETIWEAVQSLQEPETPVIYDMYGFGAVPTAAFAGKNHDLTLKKALDFVGSSRFAIEYDKDPVKVKPGGAKIGTTRVKRVVRTPKRVSTADVQNSSVSTPVTIGRPRKYPTVGATLDFSTMTEEEIYKAVTSQKRAQDYLRKKARSLIDERVALGISQEEAETAVLAELDLTAEALAGNTIQGPPQGMPSKPKTPKKRKRESAKSTYWPSIAAHTLALSQPPKLVGPSSKKQKQLKTQNSGRNQTSSKLGYLPSTLTHTLLLPGSKQNSARRFVKKRQKGVTKHTDISTSITGPPTVLVDSPSRTVSQPEQQTDFLSFSMNGDGVEQNTSVLPSLPKSYNERIGLLPGNPTIKAPSLQSGVRAVGSPGNDNVAMEDAPDSRPETDEQRISSQVHLLTSSTTSDPGPSGVSQVDNQGSPQKRKASDMNTMSNPDTPSKRRLLEHGSAVPGQESTHAIENIVSSDVAGVESTPTTVGLPDASPSELGANIIEPNTLPTLNPFKKPQQARITPFGGTIAAMRKLIILGIIRNCGGAFPGDGELVYPFLTSYVKKFPDAKPDNKTIKLAKTTLIGEGLLKQVFFSCKSPSGLVQSKSIIALPEIPDSDPRIKDLQQSMAKSHPHPFFPPGTHIRPDLVPKAAAYNPTGAVPRQGTYANELPIVSDLVKRQYPRKKDAKPTRTATGSSKTMDNGENQTSASIVMRTPTGSARNTMFALSKDTEAVENVVENGASNDDASKAQSSSARPIRKPRKNAPNRGKPKALQDIAGNAESLASGLDTAVHPSVTTSKLKPKDIQKAKAQAKSVNTVSIIDNPSLTGAGQSSLEHGLPSQLTSTGHAGILTEQPSSEPAPTRKSSRKRSVVSHRAETPQPKRRREKESLSMKETQAVHTANQRGSQATTTSTPEINTPVFDSIFLSGVSPIPRPPLSQASSKQQAGQITTTNSAVSKHRTAALPNMADRAPGSSFIGTSTIPANKDSTAWQAFSSMTDNVARWETSQAQTSQNAPPGIFVHYPFPSKNHQTAPVENNPVGRKATKTTNPRAQRPKEKQQKTIEPVRTAAQDRSQVLVGDEDTEYIDRPKRKKNKKNATKLSALEVLAQKEEKTPGVRFSKGKSDGPRPVETRRTRYQWDEEDDRRLLVASIFGHIALGGVREENHWGIVSKMLDHKYERELCRRRWAAVRTRYRADIEVIASELRTALLDAYERGQAPKLDFAHFWDNDWIAIMAWAMDTIDNPQGEDIELPTTRKEFEATFLTQDFAEHDGPDFLESRKIASVPLRHAILNTGPRVLEDVLDEGSSDIELARTYIRANILTPQESYNSQDAKAKLEQFSESTIEDAVKELQRNRIIAQTARGRAVPERGYDVSAIFIKAMQWKLSVSHFKYAAAFKETLDANFEADGQIGYKSAFGDGDVITLLNLLADDLIEIKGNNIPNSKFGLTKEGYKTRTMDKRIFNFDVLVKPTKDYCNGLGQRPLPPAPTRFLDTARNNKEDPRIPLWIDINGDLLSIMWDFAVAAVGTILVVFTAADAQHIAERLHPCLADFEVRLIMQWLVDAGAAEWKDEKHDVLDLKTYWWSVIATPIAKGGNVDETTTSIAGASTV